MPTVAPSATTAADPPVTTGASFTGLMKKLKVVVQLSGCTVPGLAGSATSTPADADSRTLDSKSSLSGLCS